MSEDDLTKPDSPRPKRSVSPTGTPRVLQPSAKESEFPRFGADDDDNSDGVTLATIPVQLLDYTMVHASEADWRRMNLDVFKALRNSRNKDRANNAAEHEAIASSIAKLEKAVTDAADQRQHEAQRRAAWISTAGVVGSALVAGLFAWAIAHENAQATSAPPAQSSQHR